MSDQEFKAAKFEIVTRYSELKQRIGVVELKLKAFGGQLSNLGEDLKRFGHLPRHMVGDTLPFEEITALLAERARLGEDLAAASKEMETTGIPLF